MSDAARRTVRTAVQTLLGLLAALPLLAGAHSLPDRLPGLGVALAVATAVTRAMALPGVQQLLPDWLRTAPAAPVLPVPPSVPAGRLGQLEPVSPAAPAGQQAPVAPVAPAGQEPPR